MRQNYLFYFCLILCLTGVPGEEESIYRAVQKFLVNEGLDAGPLDETAYMTLITKALKTYLQLQGYSLEVNESWDEELIKALQEFLNGIDNTGLWVDGDFGSKTKRSLRYFVEKDVCNLGGFLFPGPYLIPAIGNVASWKDCSGLCRKESICSDWSWSNSTCYLVSNKRSDQKIPVKLAVSGDRRCGLFTESACPNLVAGEAAGGTEKQWKGNHTTENCIKKCLENPLSVGITTQSADQNVLSFGKDDVLCWCEFGYKWLNIDYNSKDYETCSFPNEDSVIKVKISPVNLSPNNFTCRVRGGRDLSTMEFTVLNLDEEKYQKMGPNYIFIPDEEFEKNLSISCRIFDKRGIMIAEDWKIINSTETKKDTFTITYTMGLIIGVSVTALIVGSAITWCWCNRDKKGTATNSTEEDPGVFRIKDKDGKVLSEDYIQLCCGLPLDRDSSSGQFLAQLKRYHGTEIIERVEENEEYGYAYGLCDYETGEIVDYNVGYRAAEDSDSDGESVAEIKDINTMYGRAST